MIELTGCGKSTLLRLIAGLLQPTAGQIRLAGGPVTGPSPQLSMMFQRPALLPSRSVLDNKLLPVEMLGRDKARHRQYARDLSRIVDIDIPRPHTLGADRPRRAGGRDQRGAARATDGVGGGHRGGGGPVNRLSRTGDRREIWTLPVLVVVAAERGLVPGAEEHR